jgi:amino acid transporter
MFAYGGFEAPLIPAAEAKDPRRDSGPALLLALALVAATYMLVQLAIVGVLPHAGASKTPVAGAFSVLIGPPGLVLAALAAMVSIYGYTTGNTLQTPRILHAMADRGELPSFLSTVHPKWRTPHVAILLYALVVLAIACVGSFAANATLSAIARLVTYGLTCAALPILRRREGELPAGFRVRAGALVAVAGSGFCLWLLSTRSWDQAGWLLAIVATGALLRFLTAARGPEKAAARD